MHWVPPGLPPGTWAPYTIDNPAALADCLHAALVLATDRYRGQRAVKDCESGNAIPMRDVTRATTLHVDLCTMQSSNGDALQALQVRLSINPAGLLPYVRGKPNKMPARRIVRETQIEFTESHPPDSAHVGPERGR